MEQPNITTAKGNGQRKYIPFLLILPFLVLPSVLLFAFGNARWGFISLAVLLPVCIIMALGFYMPRVLPGPDLNQLHQIYFHMTEDERRRAKKVGRGGTIIIGLLGGAFMATYLLVSHNIFGVKQPAESPALIIGFLVVILIEIPLILRQRKKWIRFALSTKYAREKGLDTI